MSAIKIIFLKGISLQFVFVIARMTAVYRNWASENKRSIYNTRECAHANTYLYLYLCLYTDISYYADCWEFGRMTLLLLYTYMAFIMIKATSFNRNSMKTLTNYGKDSTRDKRERESGGERKTYALIYTAVWLFYCRQKICLSCRINFCISSIFMLYQMILAFHYNPCRSV